MPARGSNAARIRTICERAGANIAAVNYHFGDKEQLYVEAVLDAHRCGIEAEGEEDESALTPAEQLRCFIHHFLCHVLAINDPDDWRHRLMLREMLHPTVGLGCPDPRDDPAASSSGLQRILRRFCPEADERKLNALAFSVIGQCLHYRMARPVTERLIGPEAFEALDLDYLTDHITSFCLAALGCVPPLERGGGDRLGRGGRPHVERRVARWAGSRSRCWSATRRSSSASSWG